MQVYNLLRLSTYFRVVVVDAQTFLIPNLIYGYYKSTNMSYNLFTYFRVVVVDAQTLLIPNFTYDD